MIRKLSLILLILVLALACSPKYLNHRQAIFSSSFPIEVAGGNITLHASMIKDNRKQAPALLLIPEPFENHHVFDLNDLGMTRYFAFAGYRVYSMDWPNADPDAEPYDFDRMVNHFLPAVVKAVEKTEKDRKIVLIGHGFGGLAVLNYMAKNPAKPMAAVAIGTPGGMVIGNGIWDWLADLEKSSPPVASVSVAKGVDIKVPYPGIDKSILQTLLTNDKNFDPETRSKYHQKALQSIPGKLAKQIIGWYRMGKHSKGSEKIEYFTSLSKVKKPVLFIVGRIDNLVDPYESILAQQRLGSEEKPLRIFSHVNRYKSDYGHTGLLLGPNAFSEVFPYIENWIESLE